jgi:hypothetical protein
MSTPFYEATENVTRRSTEGEAERQGCSERSGKGKRKRGGTRKRMQQRMAR